MRTRDADQLNNTADACNAALALINAGHLSRDDLRELSSAAAREICRARAVAHRDDREARASRASARRKRSRPTSATSDNAARASRGTCASRTSRRRKSADEIDYRAAKTARARDGRRRYSRRLPKALLSTFTRCWSATRRQSSSPRCKRALPIVSMEEDFASLRRVDFALAEHEQVTGKWRERLTPQGKKVVPFKLLSKGEAA